MNAEQLSKKKDGGFVVRRQDGFGGCFETHFDEVGAPIVQKQYAAVGSHFSNRMRFVLPNANEDGEYTWGEWSPMRADGDPA